MLVDHEKLSRGPVYFQYLPQFDCYKNITGTFLNLGKQTTLGGLDAV